MVARHVGDRSVAIWYYSAVHGSSQRAPKSHSRFYLMFHKRIVLCSAAAVLALAIACSKSAETPTSPSVSESGSANAGPDGSTLKVTAPTVISPTNGAQPDSLVLTASKADGKFVKGMPLSYQFQISTDGGQIISACTQNVEADPSASS